MRGRWALLWGALTLGAFVFAAEPGFPARPVRIIVPQSPGGQTDVAARIIGQRLADTFKQGVVIDNRPGSSGIAGTEIVARAQPDGYTLLVVASSFSINAALARKLPYDTLRDFTAVTQFSKLPFLLAAHPGFTATTLQELLARARAKPGQITYASAGPATGTHMSVELLKYLTGVDLLHVPYKGGGPAMLAALGGQTQLVMSTSLGLLTHVRSGKLRAIAVTSANRAAAAPEIPTIAESGVPGYENETWQGMFAPAGTPQPVLARLHADLVRVLESREVKKIFENEGAAAVGNSPEAFAALLRSEIEKWAKVTKATNIKLD